MSVVTWKVFKKKNQRSAPSSPLIKSLSGIIGEKNFALRLCSQYRGLGTRQSIRGNGVLNKAYNPAEIMFCLHMEAEVEELMLGKSTRFRVHYTQEALLSNCQA